MDEQSASRGRPLKGAASRTGRIGMRIEPSDKERYERAAAQAEMSLTDWIKARLDKAARRELGE